MASSDRVGKAGRVFIPRRVQEYILAFLVLGLSTLLANSGHLGRIDRPRRVSPELYERYKAYLFDNDTAEFLRLLGLSADSLRRGKVYVPISNYDCPATYLVTAGGAVAFVGARPVVAHHVFGLVVFFMNGLFAYVFLRTVSRDHGLSLLGAVAYQCSNYVATALYMGHLHNAQVEWLPLAFLAVYRMSRGRAVLGWSALLGTAVGMQVLSSPSYTLYLGLVALPCFAFFGLFRRYRRGAIGLPGLRRFALGVVLAVPLAALVSGFYLLPRLRSLPVVFRAPTWRPFVFDHYLELLDPSDPLLFIGLPSFVVTALALRYWYYHPRRLPTEFVATMLLALLMMLPALPGTPYWFFHKFVPLADRVRVPARFFPIFHLMLISVCVLYLRRSTAGLSVARKRAAVGGAWCLLAAFNWLISPWVLSFDLVAFAKDLVGRS